MGSFRPVGFAAGTAVSGTYAYVAEGNAGFFAIDISDVTRPRQVGSLTVDGSSRDVVVRQNLAYLMTYGAGPSDLHILDLSDPARPALAGLYHITEGQPRSLDIAGRSCLHCD